MSEPSKKPDPPKESNPPKKLEARPAGAPPNREDVFKNPLPDYPDDGKPDDASSKEETFNVKEALNDFKNDVKNKFRRASMQLLGKKNDAEEEDGSKKDK